MSRLIRIYTVCHSIFPQAAILVLARFKNKFCQGSSCSLIRLAGNEDPDKNAHVCIGLRRLHMLQGAFFAMNSKIKR